MPTRFVRACPRGHVDDLNWRGFVHEGRDRPAAASCGCVERGTGGDLADLRVRCECGRSRGMHEAADSASRRSAPAAGARPWLGAGAHEQCGLPSRLLIRTAANAYFPQVLSALSLPEHGSQGAGGGAGRRGTTCRSSTTPPASPFMKKKPKVAHEARRLLRRRRARARSTALKGGDADEPPVKLVELDALLAAPEGYGDDVPVDPDFHARRLPDARLAARLRRPRDRRSRRA